MKSGSRFPTLLLPYTILNKNTSLHSLISKIASAKKFLFPVGLVILFGRRSFN